MYYTQCLQYTGACYYTKSRAIFDSKSVRDNPSPDSSCNQAWTYVLIHCGGDLCVPPLQKQLRECHALHRCRCKTVQATKKEGKLWHLVDRLHHYRLSDHLVFWVAPCDWLTFYWSGQSFKSCWHNVPRAFTYCMCIWSAISLQLWCLALMRWLLILFNLVTAVYFSKYFLLRSLH